MEVKFSYKKSSPISNELCKELESKANSILQESEHGDLILAATYMLKAVEHLKSYELEQYKRGLNHDTRT